MKNHLLTLAFVCCCVKLIAGEIDNKAAVKPAKPKVWKTFDLASVRLLPGSPFYKAMQVDQQYMLGMDVERMLNWIRKRAGETPVTTQYPGSDQPVNTRPGDLNHYLSAVSLMYGQTGDERFRERSNYMVNVMAKCYEKTGTMLTPHVLKAWDKILAGTLELKGPDETGYPWDGTIGNDFYSIHKEMAAFRDAYLYCGNQQALKLMIKLGDEVSEFTLKCNPDLFDDLLDIEHGGMNEVFADLYELTGNKKYMDVSEKFNHQKVILNIANNKDILYGRHVNMQVPTFAGTARQYQLTGDEVSRKATENFLNMVYRDHMSVIGGSGRYERYGMPGETTNELGFTADETCATYNMLKVALNTFESTGDLRHMEYFERALYNHILASQDPESGGVTYYTSLMAGGFKSFSNVYDLTGVWCCVGTGMENHAKYGEAIYFHNDTNLYVNLFIPSGLNWKEKGLDLSMQTEFPANDRVTIKVNSNNSFNNQLCIRYPQWAENGVRVWINDKPVVVNSNPGEYIRLCYDWKAGDVIRLDVPQTFHLETAVDDANMAAIFHGPIVLAGEFGKKDMPGPDLVRHAHMQYRSWVPPTDDIPMLVADPKNPGSWLKNGKEPLQFVTVKAGVLNGKTKDVSLIPYYQMRHQRMNVYWKIYSQDEVQKYRQTVSDEVNQANAAMEKAHNLQASKSDTSRFKDDRPFWENNRIGRLANDGGWFSYDLKVDPKQAKHFIVATYWGGERKNHEFDIVVGDKVLTTENIAAREQLMFYDTAYEIPDDLVKGKTKITVKFQAKPGKSAGAIYGLKITSDPQEFKNCMFY